jgi:hypothetical protein
MSSNTSANAYKQPNSNLRHGGEQVPYGCGGGRCAIDTGRKRRYDDVVFAHATPCVRIRVGKVLFKVGRRFVTVIEQGSGGSSLAGKRRNPANGIRVHLAHADNGWEAGFSH